MFLYTNQDKTEEKREIFVVPNVKHQASPVKCTNERQKYQKPFINHKFCSILRILLLHSHTLRIALKICSNVSNIFSNKIATRHTKQKKERKSENKTRSINIFLICFCASFRKYFANVAGSTYK